jgi:membrane protease subunit (stomatin/prohibitin family)
MRVLGDMAGYTRFQAAEAIETAAGSDGGVAGIGAGAAAAAALGGAMSAGLSQSAPPAPVAAEDPFALLEKLHKLLTIGALSQQEFDAKKAEILARVK